MDQRDDVRVVMCAPGFPRSLDDADKPFLLDHARALVAAGIEVIVICPANENFPASQNIEGIEVIRVRYAPRRFQTLAATGSMYREARGLKALLVIPMLLSMVASTIRQLRQGRTLAYGHWWIPGGLVAVIAAKCSRRQSVVHIHGSDAFITKGMALRKLARLVLRRADVRLAVSEELAQWAKDISGKAINVLPMPVAFDRLPALSPVPSDGYILGVGRLVHEKGFDLLIDAVELLDKSSRPKIVIVGDGPERHVLAERAARAQVSLRLPGAVPPTELADWYQGALMVAVPSRREGFGLVAAEAAAAGRAVVGSSVGGLPNIVDSGKSGLLVEPDDVNALCTALKEVDPNWGLHGPDTVLNLSLREHGDFLRQICDDLKP